MAGLFKASVPLIRSSYQSLPFYSHFYSLFLQPSLLRRLLSFPLAFLTSCGYQIIQAFFLHLDSKHWSLFCLYFPQNIFIKHLFLFKVLIASFCRTTYLLPQVSSSYARKWSNTHFYIGELILDNN